MNRDGVAIDDDGLARAVDAVRRSRGVAIGGYAREFLRGLVKGAIVREGAADLETLVERLGTEPACADRFLASLRVGTTSLFRDASAFRAIRRDVMPALRLEGHARIWIAGCSTGEEVYSLAIVLRDEGLLDRCRIYATDVNPHALDVARRGVYRAAALREGIPRYQASGGRESLCEIYTAEGGLVTFDPSLRANVVFARHDLGTDGRFQEFELVLCRNVLIWFGQSMRDIAIGVLRDSLKPGGTLALGRRESPRDSPVGALFERVVPGVPLWRLPHHPNASAATSPDALDVMAPSAATAPNRRFPDASTRTAASDRSEPPPVRAPRPPEPSLVAS